MPRPSTIAKLPEAIRSEIGRLRAQGCTIDEILAHLRTLPSLQNGDAASPSRSALGRHIQGLDKIGERMRRSRQVADALVEQLGSAPESRTAQLNIELLHSAMLDLFMRSADGGAVDEDGQAALAGSPEGLKFLAQAIENLTRASKQNVDAVRAAEARAEARAEKRTKAEAAKTVETVAKERGVGADTVEAIKARIFGVAA